MGNRLTPLEALIACREAAGSESKLGRALGIPQSTMWRIIHYEQQLRAEYVLKAERLFGVSRHDLRPDIYPREGSLAGVVANDANDAQRATHRLSGTAK